jgi:hypothetical protein
MTLRYLTALPLLALAATTTYAATPLLAGAGKATIALTPDMLPIDNFKVVLDPLEIRVLTLEEDGAKAALAVIDETSLSTSDVAWMKAAVASATGTPEANVLVIASHTFSAPHLFAANPPPGMTVEAEETARARTYLAAVRAALESAARTAAAQRRPATLAFGTSQTKVNINRNVTTPQGWWLGADETGYSDRTFSILRLDGADGKPIASLANFAVQSSIMDQTGAPGGGKAVSADLAGATVRRIESLLGGVSLFTTGSAGDQIPAYTARRNVYGADGKPVPTDLGPAGYPLVALQGDRLGDAAIRAAAAAKPAGAGRLAVFNGAVSLTTQERPKQLSQLRPTREYKYNVTGKTDAPFTLMTKGDIAIVGVQVELNAATGAWIRAHSPFPHTVVATMVNGAAKYLPDAESYKRITYQAMNSSYGPGSAEVMAQAIVAQLARMAPPPARRKARK